MTGFIFEDLYCRPFFRLKTPTRGLNIRILKDRVAYKKEAVRPMEIKQCGHICIGELGLCCRCDRKSLADYSVYIYCGICNASLSY